MSVDESFPSNLVRHYKLENLLEVVLISNSDLVNSELSIGIEVDLNNDLDNFLGFSKLLTCLSQYLEDKNGNNYKISDPINGNDKCRMYYWLPKSTEAIIELSGIFSSDCMDIYLGLIREIIDRTVYERNEVINCIKILKKEYENELMSDSIRRRFIVSSILGRNLGGSLVLDYSTDIDFLIKKIDFFKSNYYTPDIIKIIINSPLSLEYMANLVENHFSTLKSIYVNPLKLRTSYYKPESIIKTNVRKLKRKLVQYVRTDDNISFVFVLGLGNGVHSKYSKENPLFEYLIKHFFCGDFKGTLRSGIFPLKLDCYVEYYLEGISLVWLNVFLGGEKVDLNELYELVSNSVLLLLNNGVDKKYYNFLINSCISNYMNYNYNNFSLNISRRIDSIYKYGVWHKLKRYCTDTGNSIELFNERIKELNGDNLVIFSNFGSYYNDIFCFNKLNNDYYFNDKYYFNQNEKKIMVEPYFKLKYTVCELGVETLDRIGYSGKRRKLWEARGLSGPFVNEITSNNFDIIDFSIENSNVSKPYLEINDLILTTKKSSHLEKLNEKNSSTKNLIFSTITSFFSSMIMNWYGEVVKDYNNSLLNIRENVKIWYKAKNNMRQPYFKGILSINYFSDYLSHLYSLTDLITGLIMIICFTNILEFSLYNDAKMNIYPIVNIDSSLFNSNSFSLNIMMSGYSGSLEPTLNDISFKITSEGIISEKSFFNAKNELHDILLNKKYSFTSYTKANELSSRIYIPNFPTNVRVFSKLEMMSYAKFIENLNNLKNNLCLEGLFIGNLDRNDLEKHILNFTNRLNPNITKKMCNSSIYKTFYIKDLRKFNDRKFFYHYVRPALLTNKKLPTLNSIQTEKLYIIMNEEYSKIKDKKSIAEDYTKFFNITSDKFGPNIALLDIIFYKNFDFNSGINDEYIAFLYLNDVIYNLLFLKRFYLLSKQNLSIKTSINDLNSYYKWRIILESNDHSANELGLLVSDFTDNYYNLFHNSGVELNNFFEHSKKLTEYKLSSSLSNHDINSEFNSHIYNLKYSNNTLNELKNLDKDIFLDKIEYLLKNNSMFVLIQVQSKELSKQNYEFYRNNKNNNSDFIYSSNLLKETKYGLRRVPNGYKYIKHLDQLVHDDRIPIFPSD
ncbi:hypothetical protein FG386_003684 [Cryptosporidium ryanae]|uniref:uncharacterized protein n=1 Tax=Cryptosporidium ryanae TaxID=515981 RepID=UPI003519FC3C|nr:hypothetical protein FG386_003684 [Cryptosporidium ryanae]